MEEFLTAEVIPEGTRVKLVERTSFLQGDRIKSKYTGQTGELLNALYLVEQYPDPEQLSDEEKIAVNEWMLLFQGDDEAVNVSLSPFALHVKFGSKVLCTSLIKSVVLEDEMIVAVYTLNSVYRFLLLSEKEVH